MDEYVSATEPSVEPGKLRAVRFYKSRGFRNRDVQFCRLRISPSLRNIVQIFRLSLSQFSHVRGTKWRRGCNTRLQLHVTWKYDYASELVHPIHVGACSCVTTRDRRLPREEAESRGRDGRSSTLWAPFLAASPSSLCGRLHLSFLPLPPRSSSSRSLYRSSRFHAKSRPPLIQPRPTGHSSRTAHYRYYELA